MGNVPPRPVLFFLVVLSLFFSGFAGFAQTTEASAASPTRAEKTLIRVINDARATHGVRRLSVGSTIQTYAHSWSRYLLAKNAFYHGSLGYSVTENIAWLTCRSGWARRIVRMWLDSYVHRVNMLDRSARRVGVGVATGRWNGWSCVRIAVARFK